MEAELMFHIILESPTAGVDFALQKGKGSNYEIVQKQRSISDDLHFEFIAILRSSKSTEVDYYGPFVQGPAGGRFVYIDIGTYAGQMNTPWSRRLKIPLTGITSEQLSKRIDDSPFIFQTKVPGAGKDGGPNCATVKPFAGWKLVKP